MIAPYDSEEKQPVKLREPGEYRPVWDFDVGWTGEMINLV